MSSPSPRSTVRRSGSRRVAAAVGVLLVAAGCTSEPGPAAGALDADAGRARLASACASTSDRLDALGDPTDDAARPAWAREVSAILRDESETVASLTLLDEEQRDDLRAFSDNTAGQATAWNELADLFASGLDLSAEPRVGELTTEIAELGLGRDVLSDELGVAACRRG